MLTFVTSTGCSWTRPCLKSTGNSVVIDGWKSWRTLYEIDANMKSLFPNATHLIEMTPNYHQEDPLFVAVPCHLKAGTKHQMIIYADDEEPALQVKVKKFVNWN